MSPARDRNKEAENEELRAKRKAVEKTPADKELAPEATLPPEVEAQALVDDRFSSSANLTRKAHVLQGIQRSHGNAYVQRLVDRASEDIGSDDRFEVSQEVNERIEATRSSGHRLDPAIRAQMEPAFGKDLSDVHVHTDSEASLLAEQVQAEAFTAGKDIFFREGNYAPGSAEGKELLAHELTHVAGEVADRSHQTGKPAHVLRRPTTVAAPFIGGSPFNDSDVTFTPTGAVWINGRQTSTTDFPGGGTGTVQIRAGERGVVQLSMGLHVFVDNILINEEFDQSFYVDWDISATPEGVLTIDPSPRSTVNPRSGGTPSMAALQSVNPSQGSNFVQVNPVITGSGATTGISLGVTGETAMPAHFLQRPFRLNIEVTDIREPEVTITMGPVRLLRTHEVLFERPRQDRVSVAQQDELVRWYEGLSEPTRGRVEQGEEPVNLEGHASTTGTPTENLELSGRRMEAVRRILQLYAGSRADFPSRAVGAYRALTPDQVEAQEERKVVVSVWETAEEEETAP